MTSYTIKPLEWQTRHAGDFSEEWATPIEGREYVVYATGGAWIAVGLPKTLAVPKFPTEQLAKYACQLHWEHTLAASLAPDEDTSLLLLEARDAINGRADELGERGSTQRADELYAIVEKIDQHLNRYNAL